MKDVKEEELQVGGGVCEECCGVYLWKEVANKRGGKRERERERGKERREEREIEQK